MWEGLSLPTHRLGVSVVLTLGTVYGAVTEPASDECMYAGARASVLSCVYTRVCVYVSRHYSPVYTRRRLGVEAVSLACDNRIKNGRSRSEASFLMARGSKRWLLRCQAGFGLGT